VRGLAGFKKKAEVRKLVNEQKLFILYHQETKLSVVYEYLCVHYGTACHVVFLSVDLLVLLKAYLLFGIVMKCRCGLPFPMIICC